MTDLSQVSWTVEITRSDSSFLKSHIANVHDITTAKVSKMCFLKCVKPEACIQYLLSVSAFLAGTSHQCWSAGWSLGWSLRFLLLVSGILWSSSSRLSQRSLVSSPPLVNGCSQWIETEKKCKFYSVKIDNWAIPLHHEAQARKVVHDLHIIMFCLCEHECWRGGVSRL